MVGSRLTLMKLRQNPSQFQHPQQEMITALPSKSGREHITFAHPTKPKLLPSYGLQLAKIERWSHIIVEGDAKSCFDSLASPASTPDFSICYIISNILCFRQFIAGCIFLWVKRDCNLAAHAAAKFFLRTLQSSRGSCSRLQVKTAFLSLLSNNTLKLIKNK